MSATLGRAFLHNFLGQAPAWYKYTIIAFLAVNPLIHLTLGPVVAGWLLLAEFIFTLPWPSSATHSSRVACLPSKQY